MNPKNRWIDLADRIPWDVFDAGTLVLFRKRLTHEIIMETNEYMLDHQDDDRTPPASGSGKEETPGDSQEEPVNHGTLIVDAACAPANIRFPQDISLLNEARGKLETTIYRFCILYGSPLPRRYMRKARKECKAKMPVEFGAKLDLSIDENSYSRIEHISFEAYNESGYLQEAIGRYHERAGYYPYLQRTTLKCRGRFSASCYVFGNHSLSAFLRQ